MACALPSMSSCAVTLSVSVAVTKDSTTRSFQLKSTQHYRVSLTASVDGDIVNLNDQGKPCVVNPGTGPSANPVFTCSAPESGQNLVPTAFTFKGGSLTSSTNALEVEQDGEVKVVELAQAKAHFVMLSPGETY